MTSEKDIHAVKPEYVSYPAGRYQLYENKIRKLAKVFEFVRRHRIAFSLTFIALAVIFFCFTYCMGIFTQDIECADLIYGEEFAVNAKAFFADIEFEYSVAGSGQWTDAFPVSPGEYNVRGVSENLYGKQRYSKTASFTFYARDAVIDIPDVSCEYGDLNDEFLSKILQTSNLAEGDILSELVFSIESEGWESAAAVLTEYRIINAEGLDVTSAYNVTSNGGTVTVVPRKIEIAAKNVTKVYDGKPAEKPEYTFRYGSLAEGDKLSVSFRAMPTKAGRYSSVPDDYKILNSGGQDVTERYDIKFEYGTVTIEQRKLLFSTGSAEKIYDGTPITNDEWTLLSGTLADGHVMTVQTTGKRAVAGTGDNTLNVKITDKNGNYVTENYEISVKYGTLTITPITLKFKTESAEKVYDGKRLIAPGYEHISGELLPGHTMSCETDGSLVGAGERENTLRVIIYGTNGSVINEQGYRIEVDTGTLKITPRPITVTSASAEKLYDGTPLEAPSCAVTEGSLVEGHTVKGFYTGKQTEVGESPNYFVISINDRNGNGYINNYEITRIYGTLKVLPNPDYDPDIPLPGGNGGIGGGTVDVGGGGGGDNDPGEGEQDGNSSFEVGTSTGIGFTDPNAKEITFARVKLSGYGAQPFIAYLRATSYGKYTGFGFEAANDYTYSNISPLDYIGRANGGYENALWTMHIERLSGCPVIIPYYSYNLNTFGTSDSYFRSEIMEYDHVFVRLTDSIEDMRKYSHNSFYDTTAFYDEIGYYTDYVYTEYLQISDYTKAELLRIGEENGIYDDEDKFALAAEIQKYVKNAGSYNLYGTPYPPDVDVAVYFLDVAKEGICQHFAAAATMMYRAYGIPARYVTGFAVNVEPDTTVSVSSMDAHAWVEIYFKDLGWVPVEVTGSGNGVAGTKIELHVSAYSATKEYDGKIFSEWNSEKVVITKGILLPGHTLKVELSEGRYNSAPGVYSNRITGIKVYDSNGKDVTDKYYRLSYRDGTMTIKKRRLVIQLGSASKQYDGTPLRCEEWRLVSGTVLPNTEIRIETLAEITDVGTITNGSARIYVYETRNGILYDDITDCYEITVLPGRLEITE